MANSYVAGDYAGIDGGHLSAYYGYEETTDDGEWCFVARVGEMELMRVPRSELQTGDVLDCAACLLAGIAMLFDRYGVK